MESPAIWIRRSRKDHSHKLLKMKFFSRLPISTLLLICFVLSEQAITQPQRIFDWIDKEGAMGTLEFKKAWKFNDVIIDVDKKQAPDPKVNSKEQKERLKN